MHRSWMLCVGQCLQFDALDVYVLLRTTAAADHIAGGVPLPEWQPEDTPVT